MGPRYRLILPEYPPDRDHWVMPDQIVYSNGVPHPYIDLRMMARMLGLNYRETDFLRKSLKKFPEAKRGQGVRDIVNLHIMELVIEDLFKYKTSFRFDRLYLGLAHVRNLAYLHGYIDVNGYRLYPDESIYKEYHHDWTMSKQSIKKIRKGK